MNGAARLRVRADGWPRDFSSSSLSPTLASSLVTPVPPFEKLLLRDASSRILDTDVLASVGERWSRLDRMAESYGDSIASLRSLKRWWVVP